MARRKSWRPGKKAEKPGKSDAKTGIPKAPSIPAPVQPKLEGFTTPELEEIEAASERFAIVQDRVKNKKKELQGELDKEETKLIEVMKKYGRDSIVIGGYTVQVVKTEKAKVKGLPTPKEETASRDYENDDKTGPETEAETAARLRRESDDTTIEISTPGRRSVTVTPEAMKKMAKNAGKVAREMGV